MAVIVGPANDCTRAVKHKVCKVRAEALAGILKITFIREDGRQIIFATADFEVIDGIKWAASRAGGKVNEGVEVGDEGKGKEP